MHAVFLCDHSTGCKTYSFTTDGYGVFNVHEFGCVSYRRRWGMGWGGGGSSCFVLVSITENDQTDTFLFYPFVRECHKIMSSLSIHKKLSTPSHSVHFTVCRHGNCPKKKPQKLGGSGGMSPRNFPPHYIQIYAIWGHLTA